MRNFGKILFNIYKYYEMSINFFKHTIQKMIKISLCESEAFADVHKFLISINSDN
jgi:hypothetical protein